MDKQCEEVMNKSSASKLSIAYY